MNSVDVITREQLEGWIGQLNDPRDKCLLLALYEGIGDKNFTDLIYLKLSDFHDDKADLYSGRTIRVSSLLYKYAKEAAEAKEYVPLRQATPLADEDRVFKTSANASDDSEDGRRRRIQREFVTIREKLNFQYTTKDVAQSGRLNMIKQGVSETGLLPLAYMKFYYKDIANQYGEFRAKLLYDEYKEYLG